MKMYKVNTTVFDPDLKAAWDRYSQTGADIDKPSSSKGMSPRVIVTNQRQKGAGCWRIKSRMRCH